MYILVVYVCATFSPDSGSECRWVTITSRPLARISQTVECIGGANQRKLLCHNDFPLIPEAPDADRVYAESV
jgi:hypothetical protein